MARELRELWDTVVVLLARKKKRSNRNRRRTDARENDQFFSANKAAKSPKLKDARTKERMGKNMNEWMQILRWKTSAEQVGELKELI